MPEIWFQTVISLCPNDYLYPKGRYPIENTIGSLTISREVRIDCTYRYLPTDDRNDMLFCSWWLSGLTVNITQVYINTSHFITTITNNISIDGVCCDITGYSVNCPTYHSL